MSSAAQVDGTTIMREFLPHSPFVRHLGIELASIEEGSAELVLPFRAEITTIADVVHGGAIATLIDTAAMTAAWAGADVPETLRGATVDLSVSYLAPADGASLSARAAVVRRGRRLVNVRVDVHADTTHVATAIVTYQIG